MYNEMCLRISRFRNERILLIRSFDAFSLITARTSLALFKRSCLETIFILAQSGSYFSLPNNVKFEKKIAYALSFVLFYMKAKVKINVSCFFFLCVEKANMCKIDRRPDTRCVKKGFFV